MSAIRAKSVCIFRHHDGVLLTEGYDPAKDEHYLIPIGGGIDFGETSEQAARRETLEEIGAEAHSFKLLGVLENLFSFDGKQGHEIVFVYEARFEDTSFYEAPELQGTESNGSKFMARWFSRDQLRAGNLRIYPSGIENMLLQQTNK
ncbi:NUDIX hydrolase [Thauera sp. Sel9]|uniref:NUDIX hydrolase n=1 Tax=Thauera sp. Sel9 TaxID=2974299 RepID=UPI0021E173F9|nr:NUDIX hydrolase [Thauera sp. Sel9]MCV2216601.1 NUDIX hydrolase [Thauera sp. Sel9]